MVFFLEITNIWQKSLDFWFVGFYLIILQVNIFYIEFMAQIFLLS
jgi:hypothetical protein